MTKWFKSSMLELIESELNLYVNLSSTTVNIDYLLHSFTDSTPWMQILSHVESEEGVFPFAIQMAKNAYLKYESECTFAVHNLMFS